MEIIDKRRVTLEPDEERVRTDEKIDWRERVRHEPYIRGVHFPKENT